MRTNLDRHALTQTVRGSVIHGRTALKTRIEGHHRLHYLFAVTYGTAAERIRAAPDRRRTDSLLSTGAPIVADIRLPMGLGGILTWIGRVLDLANRLDQPIGISCSSASYRPSWPMTDWIDCYFERQNQFAEQAHLVDVASLPLRPYQPISAVADQVWRYLSIRPEYLSAKNAIPFPVFASVHYRGSDKYLDAPRVSADSALRRLELEMSAANLTKLFVASDELSFVQLAKERFGEDCWALPLVAVANGTLPPHMANVAGEIKAREALTTMVLLAQSQLCLRTESGLSEWAMTMPGERRAILLAGSHRRLFRGAQ